MYSTNIMCLFVCSCECVCIMAKERVINVNEMYTARIYNEKYFIMNVCSSSETIIIIIMIIGQCSRRSAFIWFGLHLHSTFFRAYKTHGHAFVTIASHVSIPFVINARLHVIIIDEMSMCVCMCVI